MVYISLQEQRVRIILPERFADQASYSLFCSKTGE